jgi:hypothetical protein
MAECAINVAVDPEARRIARSAEIETSLIIFGMLREVETMASQQIKSPLIAFLVEHLKPSLKTRLQ